VSLRHGIVGPAFTRQYRCHFSGCRATCGVGVLFGDRPDVVARCRVKRAHQRWFAVLSDREDIHGLHAAHVPCHAGWVAIHSRAVAQRVLANRLKLEAELLQGIEDVTPADYQGDVKV